MGEKLNGALAVILSFFVGGLLLFLAVIGGIIVLPLWLLVAGFLALGVAIFGVIQFVYIVYAFIDSATKEKKTEPPKSYKLEESKEAK